MTEQEWVECNEPMLMLKLLQGKASDRKLRLFACACCRRFWQVMDEPSRAILEVAERYADNQATPQERRAASISERDYELAYPAVMNARNEAITCTIAVSMGKTAFMPGRPKLGQINKAGESAWWAAQVAAFERVPSAKTQTHRESNMPFIKARMEEGQEQGRLLHDIFGNPFRPVAIDPVWLTWHDGTVRQLAQAIYDDRRFADLPILADALEEAGCDQADILAHFRVPGQHVRGCWAVELLLAKN